MGSRNRVSCGLDIEFNDNIEESIEVSSSHGYDFVCAPIARPGSGPFEQIKHTDKLGGGTRSQFLLSSQEWSSLVVGKLSYQPDITSVITDKRICAEEEVFNELEYLAFLGLPAVIVDVKNEDCSNIARLVLSFLHRGHHSTHVWVKIPLQCSNCEESDTWKWWNKFRTLCDYHPRIGLAIKMTSDLPGQLKRWPGEPLRAVFLPTDVFLTNKKGFPVLSKAHQQFVTSLFKLDCQVVVTGNNLLRYDNIRVYQQYLDHLYQTCRSDSQYDNFARGYEDYLQAPLQPLMDNLESSTYEIFEKDPVKYTQYEEAIFRCLLDVVPEGNEAPAILMILGAGRGPLVRASLQAAKQANRRVRCYAVEKNKNAAVFLQHLRASEWKDEDVNVVSADMRFWQAPELADIIISELLGSFGDNELSPECLDGANRFLKPNAVSIPQSYTSYIAPVSSEKLYNEIKGIGHMEKSKPPEASFETPYVVRIHNYHELTEPVPVFTFNHPNWNADSRNPKPEFFSDLQNEKWASKFPFKKIKDSERMEQEMLDNQINGNHNCSEKSSNGDKANMPPCTVSNRHNSRHTQVSVTIPFDTVLHGFAGYFRCALYKDVEISIEPGTHSPGMFSWFPIFFPLFKPIPLAQGNLLRADFWRCSSERNVWYEWCVLSPQESRIHNPNGRSYTIGL